jgi:hypothetical protein
MYIPVYTLETLSFYMNNQLFNKSNNNYHFQKDYPQQLELDTLLKCKLIKLYKYQFHLIMNSEVIHEQTHITNRKYTMLQPNGKKPTTQHQTRNYNHQTVRTSTINLPHLIKLRRGASQ